MKFPSGLSVLHEEAIAWLGMQSIRYEKEYKNVATYIL